MINIQGRELHFGDSGEIMCKCDLCVVAYKSISFKLGTSIDMAEL